MLRISHHSIRLLTNHGNDAISDAEIVNEDAANAIPEAEIVVDDDDAAKSSSFATAKNDNIMSATNRDLFSAAFACHTVITTAATAATAAAAVTASTKNTISCSDDSDSHDNEHLTLSELGPQAEKAGQFKSEAVMVDCEYLQSTKQED